MALLGIGEVRLKTFLELLTLFFLLLKMSSPIHRFLRAILHQRHHQDHDYDSAIHHIQ